MFSRNSELLSHRRVRSPLEEEEDAVISENLAKIYLMFVMMKLDAAPRLARRQPVDLVGAFVVAVCKTAGRSLNRRTKTTKAAAASP